MEVDRPVGPQAFNLSVLRHLLVLLALLAPFTLFDARAVAMRALHCKVPARLHQLPNLRMVGAAADGLNVHFLVVSSERSINVLTRVDHQVAPRASLETGLFISLIEVPGMVISQEMIAVSVSYDWNMSF